MVLELVHDIVAEQTAEQQRDALVEQVFTATAGLWDIVTVYLGDQLGLYQALVDIEPATSAELADRTGTHERYVREWLEYQAIAGNIEVDNPRASALDRRHTLPAGHAGRACRGPDRAGQPLPV